MKPVCIAQQDPSDCGAAALATVARQYGHSVNLTQLREITRTTRRGATLLGLKKAAETLGFSARGASGPFEALSGVNNPFIAHILNGQGYPHFVVIHQVDPDKVLVADPAAGRVESWTAEQFREQWRGHVLLLEPNGEPVAAVPPSSLSRIVGLVWPWKGLLGQALLAGLFFVLLGFLFSFFVQILIDSVILHQTRSLLPILGLGMLLAISVRIVFGAIRGYLLIKLSEKLNVALVSQFVRHLLSFPVRFYQDRTTGEILQRVSDSFKLQSAISSISISVVIDAVIVLSAFLIMFLYNWKLALLATLFLPVLVGVGVLFLLPMRKHQRAAMERSAKLQSALVETVTGIEAVKLANAEPEHQYECESALVKTIKSGVSAQGYQVAHGLTNVWLTSLASLLLLWIGALGVMNGDISLGQLMFFVMLAGTAMAPFEELAGVAAEVQDASIAAQRVFEYLDLEPERRASKSKVPFRRLKNGITVENLSFNYGYRADVLKEINLEIPAGRKIAFAGETGSGKTTLCRLIAGIVSPTAGHIFVDGIKWGDYDLESLRSRIGFVPQEPVIFNRTLRDNLAYGMPGASFENIIEAATAVGLHRFITGLPEGYDTMLGERGANLSGGQRQRLAIARALLMDPEIFIFDEATSHLDLATERTLHEAFQTRWRDKTVILVAHRLSTLKLADFICVVKDERIAETGTHEELIRANKEYARLIVSQTHGNGNGTQP